MKKKQTTCFEPKLKLNIQFFADEDAATDEGADTGSDEGQNTDDSQNAGKEGEDKNTELSQDELKSIAEANLLKSLGVESIKDAKTKLDSWKEYEDSKKTEEEKINDRIAQLENENSGKDNTIFELNAKLTASNMDVKAESVDDAIVLAKAMTDKDDELSIEDAIKSVVEKYPHFTKQNEDGNKVVTGAFTNTKPTRKTTVVDDPFQAKLDKYK